MELTLYLILVIYFLVGAIITIAVNRKKIKHERNQNWLKYFTYLVIVNILFASILFKIVIFHYISIVIIFFGYFEIICLIFTTNKVRTGIISLAFFSLGFYGFYKFCLLDQKYLFYVLFIVTVFDAFSQLTGQLLGKRKLLPLISPNKTVEGLVGGCFFSVLTAAIIHDLLDINVIQSVTLGFGISSFAFLGDVSASYIKREFEVKDFSKLIPGHGGFLDRFDSLIFSGLFMYIINTCFNL